MTDRHDVAVVGGGPAGAVCAARLAGAGLRVALLEKCELPRYKTCGGGLIGRARRILEDDLDGVVERVCRAARMSVAGTDLSVRIERDEPLVSMTMRAELDQRLIERAEQAGARLLAPCELRSVERRGTTIELGTSRGKLQVRYVVAADGAFSRTARAAGWDESPHLVPAVESEIRVDDTTFDRFRDEARFDIGVPAHGYAWVFPKREHLSVGCLTFARGKRQLRQALDAYLQQLGITRIERREDHGHAIPVKPRSALPARNGVLLIGDAAGLADPVICEGITNSVLSARCAAAVLRDHFDCPGTVDRAYRRALSAEILPELRLSRLLAGLLYDRPRLRRAVFSRVGRPLCDALAEIISGRQTYRSLLGRPANYLRLLARLSEASA